MFCGTCTSTARAQVEATTQVPSLPDSEDEASLGDSPDALPGLVRVGVPGWKGPRASASVHALYGFTEPQNEEESPHHRIGTAAALGVAPWSFAAIGLRADFRHDIHGEDPLGGDSGSVLDVTPMLRLGGKLESDVHLGVEGRLRLPGATDGSSGVSPELDARALAAYSGVPTWLFALMAGYRLGHGGNLAEESSSMRRGDRVALGISEFDALLLGLGVVKTINRTEVFGEVTTDMLLGGGAPGLTESPFRLSAGLRHAFIERLWLSVVVEGTPMGRAPSLPGDPLVPIEPRVQGMLGLTYRFVSPKKPVVHDQPIEEVGPEEKPEEIPPEEEEGPPPPITSSLRVIVVDKTGHPISDAKVTVDIPKTPTTPAEQKVVPLDETNVYVLDGILVGEVEVLVQADLLKPHTESVIISEGAPAEIKVKLEPAASEGSQLRGLVRSYSGEGISASVTVEPGGHSAKCDEEGSFELDLPPGVYKVIIEAEGFRSQRRTLRVRKEGVTVLNADLQQAAP